MNWAASGPAAAGSHLQSLPKAHCPPPNLDNATAARLMSVQQSSPNDAAETGKHYFVTRRSDSRWSHLGPLESSPSILHRYPPPHLAAVPCDAAIASTRTEPTGSLHPHFSSFHRRTASSTQQYSIVSVVGHGYIISQRSSARLRAWS